MCEENDSIPLSIPPITYNLSPIDTIAEEARGFGNRGPKTMRYNITQRTVKNRFLESQKVHLVYLCHRAKARALYLYDARVVYFESVKYDK